MKWTLSRRAGSISCSKSRARSAVSHVCWHGAVRWAVSLEGQGFVSPPGYPWQHQQQQNLQEKDLPMDVMTQACTQEYAKISQLAWVWLSQAPRFFQGNKTQKPPRASPQSALAQALAGGVDACSRKLLQGHRKCCLCFPVPRPIHAQFNAHFSFFITARPPDVLQPHKSAGSFWCLLWEEGMMSTPPQARAKTHSRSLKCWVLQKPLRSPEFPSAAFNENSAWQPGPRRKCPCPPQDIIPFGFLSSSAWCGRLCPRDFCGKI